MGKVRKHKRNREDQTPRIRYRQAGVHIEDSVPRDKEVLDSNRAAHEVLVGVKMAHFFLT